MAKKVKIKVISGGQVGADKIGLEEARKLGFQTGGTAPKRYKTSKGSDTTLKDYGLSEISDIETTSYQGREREWGPRTEQNVLKSDLTLLYTVEGRYDSPGSQLTRNLAKKHNKPFLQNPTPSQVSNLVSGLGKENVTINIAGNREFTNRNVISEGLKSASNPTTASIKQKFKGDTYGRRMFIEFIGNPEYTDPTTIAKIQENFIKKAADPKRANVTWVTRSQGFGKDKDQLYAKPTSGVHPQGAIGGKFGKTYKVSTAQELFAGVMSTETVDVYVPDTKAAAAAYYAKREAGNISSKPKLMKPRADLGSIVFDAASRYNRILLKGITASYSGYTGDPSKMIKEEFAKGAIRVKPFVIDGAMINAFKKQGYTAKEAYIKAVEYRDQQIKALGDRKQVAVTRKGDFETKSEISARKLYEGMQKARKDAGFKSELASDKLIDAYIDEVNIEEGGKYKYSWEFKEGARSFLENKELDWHKDFESASDMPPLMNEQRLEDTRMWGMHGEKGTTLTNYYGQDITIQGSGISGDYAYSQDYLAGGAYQDDSKGPIQITSAGEDLGPLETMKESQLIAQSRPVAVPGSIVTSSWSNIMTGGESDEVKALIYGELEDDLAGEQVMETKKAETPDADVPGSAAKGSGFQQDLGREELVTQIKMTQDYLTIEEAEVIGDWGKDLVKSGVHEGLSKETPKAMKGASLITSAFAGYEGSTTEILDVKEIRAILQASTPALAEIVGGTNVSQEGDVDARGKIVGKKAQPPKYKPTRSEITRKEIYENLPEEVKTAKKKQYPPLRNERIKERNARVQAGTQAKFMADLQNRNRKNSLIISPMQGTAGKIANPAEALLNPKAAKQKAIAPQPKTDIELKKSSILTKESGKPTFTTKGEKVKTAVKKGGSLLKGPGLTGLTMLTMGLAPIGAISDVVRYNRSQREKVSAEPLYPTKKLGFFERLGEVSSEDFEDALMHRTAPMIYPSLQNREKYKKMFVERDI